MKIAQLIILMRPRQYAKNLFIFFPLFFALKITALDLLAKNVLAFLSFCMIASAVYIFNDYRDIEEDRKHPKKKIRPLAAGTVTVPQAIILAIFLAITGLTIGMYLGLVFTKFLIVYLVMNILYSLWLKKISLIDIFIIGIGFLLRVFSGAVASGMPASMWITIMTFLLALFIALAKRRDDVLLSNSGNEVRKSIRGYNLEFLNAAMTMMAPVILIAYILYTISHDVIERFHNQYLYLTVVFVILGLLRYMQITFVENKSGSPTEILFRDRFIQLSLIGWLATFVILIYL